MGASKDMARKSVTAGLGAVADKAKSKGKLKAGSGLNKFASDPVPDPDPSLRKMIPQPSPQPSNFEEELRRRSKKNLGSAGGYGGTTNLS